MGREGEGIILGFNIMAVAVAVGVGMRIEVVWYRIQREENEKRAILEEDGAKNGGYSRWVS